MCVPQLMNRELWSIYCNQSLFGKQNLPEQFQCLYRIPDHTTNQTQHPITSFNVKLQGMFR